MRRVAVQGYSGCFHEEAALKFYGDGIETVWCDTFPELFARMDSGDADAAVMAIAAERLEGVGAVASGLAARQYGLEILAPGIETCKQNFTRFLVIDGTYEVDPSEIDKASLCFTLPHTPGSLAHILTILSFYGMNLTRIQSLPIPGREWQYFFYVDIKFDNQERYRQAISAVRPLIEEFRILGEYHSEI
ncbi:MAG: hypothetical protein MJY42_04325 [Bacteroidales bacterium]|nr:hypothetical protein [Bacteroidales bacterium]